jgi:hypothetical protein
MLFLWARSYWKVDKAWTQILPRYAVEARLTPGEITLSGSRSTDPLSIGEGDWFSWPVNAYYADYIPPPSNAILGEFSFYNGGVTLPLWFLVLLTVILNIVVDVPLVVRRFAASRAARAKAFSASIESALPGGSLLRRDHPAIAVGPPAANAQNAAVMQAVS